MKKDENRKSLQRCGFEANADSGWCIFEANVYLGLMDIFVFEYILYYLKIKIKLFENKSNRKKTHKRNKNGKKICVISIWQKEVMEICLSVKLFLFCFYLIHIVSYSTNNNDHSNRGCVVKIFCCFAFIFIFCGTESVCGWEWYFRAQYRFVLDIIVCEYHFSSFFLFVNIFSEGKKMGWMHQLRWPA